MPFLIRILIVVVIVYSFFRLLKWVPKALVKTFACPRCEGKGYWYGTREREFCKACDGTGKLSNKKT